MYCQVPLCTRTLNHVAVDNPRFQKQGYGRMVQSERGLSVGDRFEVKKKKNLKGMGYFHLDFSEDFFFRLRAFLLKQSMGLY